MVDLNVYVSDLLKTIAPVELASNSDSDEKIPCIVIEQYSNGLNFSAITPNFGSV